jgi:nucleotide-binding universal stress UspA family protein
MTSAARQTDDHNELAMFTSIVVPLDLEARGDRALPIAGALAAKAGILLELVTVSSPGLPAEFDTYELEQRGRTTGATWTTTVLHDNDPSAALVAFLADRPDALVVMATRARSAFGELLLGSVSEDLLTHSHHPVLLVGPHVSVDDATSAPTLVAGVATDPTSDALLSAVIEWNASFGGRRPWLVDILPEAIDLPNIGDVIESGDVHRLADRLKEHGVACEWEVAHAKQPAEGLIEFADGVADAVIVVASACWTDPDHPHLRSVARRLTHKAHHPVLVAPADRPARAI